MSACNYTQLVSPNTCLGDSLATFNTNFYNLDNALCMQPMVFSGNGLRLDRQYTEQNINAVRISTIPSVTYSPFFEDLINGTVSDNLTLEDSTKVRATIFPMPATSANNPAATFSAISLSNSTPKVTIFWTASGTDYTTIYATNSATSVTTDIGTSGFNGSVNAVLSTSQFIYLGGSFTSAGGYDYRKFCAIDLTKGSNPSYRDVLGNYIDRNIGLVGQVVEKPAFNNLLKTYTTHPLTDNGGFGLEGSVNALLQYGDLLIVGGSYKNVPGKNLGRGLTVWNSRSNRVYPFYINGEVNSVVVQGEDLYIGGIFNFLNYGYQSASDVSGQRIYTNGLAKISLSMIESFANKSINKIFCDNIVRTFDKNAEIHSIITTNDSAVYIGGRFQTQANGTLTTSNLALLSPDGMIGTSWQPIIDGPVHKLIIDKTTLYVGGLFSSFITALDLESAPRTYDQYANLMCFDISQPYYPATITSWKPYTNGLVTDMAVHNGRDGSEFIYCYGNFDEINGVGVTFLGAVPKNAGQENNIGEGQTPVNWRIHLDRPPLENTKGLLRLDNSLLIGGNFTQVNGDKRRHLALISGPYEELSIEAAPFVIWNLGAQLLCTGGNLALDFTQYSSVTSACVDYGNINKTIFPLEYTRKVFEGCNPGSVMRFFVQRQYTTTSGQLSAPAYVTGWKIDF